MDLKPLIDKKDEAAKYMIDEITHICKDMDTRSPGTKGEKEACEYMAKGLKEEIAAANVRTLNRLKKTPAHSSAGYTLRLPSFFWQSRFTLWHRLFHLFSLLQVLQ